VAADVIPENQDSAGEYGAENGWLWQSTAPSPFASHGETRPLIAGGVDPELSGRPLG
jgi:hypothetical protein